MAFVTPITHFNMSFVTPIAHFNLSFVTHIAHFNLCSVTPIAHFNLSFVTPIGYFTCTNIVQPSLSQKCCHPRLVTRLPVQLPGVVMGAGGGGGDKSMHIFMQCVLVIYNMHRYVNLRVFYVQMYLA